MPLDIDPALIDSLVKRQMQEEEYASPPASVEKEPDKLGLLAKLVYAAGGGADIATTAYGLASGKGVEKNPMVNWAPTAAQIPIGVGMELGGVLLANKLFKNKPNLMKALLMGLGATHGGFAAHNIKELRKSR